MTLPRRDLARIFFRSFFIQGLWTVQRAQNLGYVYSLWPVFRRLYPKREDRARVTNAHAGYFSTHPYTAGAVLGVVAGMEDDRAGSGGNIESILSVRTAMAGPLAALGEAFYWGTWLPVCVVLAVLGVRWFPAMTVTAPWWFLFGFNSIHLIVKFSGLWMGYRWKTDVVPHLAVVRVQAMLPVLAVLGMAGALWAAGSSFSTGREAVQGLLWTGFFWGILRLGLRPSVVAVGVTVGAVVWAGLKTL